MQLDNRTYSNAKNSAHQAVEKTRRLPSDGRRTLERLEDSGFDLGDVFDALRPTIEGALRPVVRSTGWLSGIIGAVVGEALDAVSDALN